MEKTDTSHVEVASRPPHEAAPGDVELFEGDEVVLIPTPTTDPKDPLNLPAWRKWTLLVLVSAYSCTAVVLCSGMGPIFSVIQQQYPGEEDRANDLLTYPTLFMGLGNFISMPFALTAGRRPVFLISMVILIASGIWCACSQSLASHIAGRNIMSLAAGQSEALSPLIVQEIHFLHERGRKLAWFIFIQNLTAGVFFVVSTYMVSAWGWRWWYGFFSILNAVVFALSIPFVSESHYHRSPESVRGQATPLSKLQTTESTDKTPQIRTAHGTVLDIERYGPRTWRHDLKFVVLTPDWRDIPTLYKQILQGFCIPITFWLLLLNGAFLGVYVFQSATFSTILLSPPYSFAFTSLGYVQAGHIVSCLIFLPLLGYGSDLTIKAFTRRNNGLFKPEYRLPMIGIPSAIGVICGIIYGQAASHPESWSYSAIVVSYNANFFAFLGANIVGITYAVDSFPLRAAPFLVVICAGRGLISFGLSYATLPAVRDIGYDGTMIVEIVICGVLALVALPMFFLGPRLRRWVRRWSGDEKV